MAWQRIRNPLPAPFFSFTDDGFRYVVFPKSVLAALKVGSGSSAHTLMKRVKTERNVRTSAPSSELPSWQRDTRQDGAVLQVQVCGSAVTELGLPQSVCPWVSVNDARLAAQLRVSDGPSYR